MQIATPSARRVQVRFVPLALGLFFAAVTARVVFNDVWHGAEISTNHILTVAALVAAIASGGILGGAIRDREPLTALSLAVIFLSSTLFVVVAAGSRNAGTLETAQKANHHVDAERARVVRLRAGAERRLSTCPAGTPRGSVGVACGLLDAVAAECATGGGTRCEGRRATVVELQASVAGYTEKLNGYAPGGTKGIDYAHAAKLFAALPLVTAAASDIERRIKLLLPFALALIVEIGTVTFLHRAFRVTPADAKTRRAHAPRQDTPARPRQDPGKTPRQDPGGMTPAEPRQVPVYGAFGFLPPDPGKTPARPRQTDPGKTPANDPGKTPVPHPLIVALEGMGGRAGSCKELADAMGVSAREERRRRREVGDRVQVVSQGPGKPNEIRLVTPATT